MKITIVIPTLNQGEYIEETIDSVFSQNYPNLEYIIIDGGSSDGTIEIIKKYEKHLAYWISEKDQGQSHAINKGLARATGDIFNWINSDDYLEPGALKTIAEAFENPETNVFIGRANVVKDGKILRQSRGTDIYPGNPAKTIGLARIDQPEHWWRKSVVDQIGPLNENLHFIMDRDWWVKYLLRFGLEGISKSEDILANFRLHGASKTVSETASFALERDAWFASMVTTYGIPFISGTPPGAAELFRNIPVEINRNVLPDALMYYYLLRADEAYVASDFASCRAYLKFVNPDVLDTSSRKLYKNLSFRTHFPPALIKFVRKQSK